jgi:hypothetical protein
VRSVGCLSADDDDAIARRYFFYIILKEKDKMDVITAKKRSDSEIRV